MSCQGSSGLPNHLSSKPQWLVGSVAWLSLRLKKSPCTVDMLTALVKSLGQSPSLNDVRLAASCLLAFASSLYFNELTKLQCCNIKFCKESMSVHIASSKTDQYRQIDTILFAHTGSITCIVAMVEKYFSMVRMSHASSLVLFHCITHTKNGEHFYSSGRLSYIRMQKLLLTKLNELYRF